MHFNNYIVINIYVIMVLAVILFKLRQHSDKYLVEQRLFLWLVYLNILMLVLDIFLLALDGRSSAFLTTANLVLSTFYYISNPVPCMLWSFYADYKVNRDTERLKKLSIPLLIPTIINGAFMIINLFNSGFMFYIDGTNHFHQGTMFPVLVGACYFYFIYTFIQIFLQRSKTSENEYYSLLAFPLAPFIGGILQYWGNMSVVWLSMSFSMFIIFINIMNNQLYLDYLTGLYNRRQLDLFIEDRLAHNSINNRDLLIGGIMMDLNYFKRINDIYGHSMGDQALVHVASILKKSMRKDDFISRYGGDEFTAIIQLHNETDLINAVNRIRNNIDQFNLQKVLPFDISLAIGFAIYDSNSVLNGNQFMKQLDDLMYDDKMNHKQINK